MPLFTIPLSAPYLKTLAHGIIDRFPQKIRQNATVILPSHRAVLSLQKVFTSDFKNIVLPKIVTISDFYKDVLYQHVKGQVDLDKNPNRVIGNTQRIHLILMVLKKKQPGKSYDLLIDLSQSIASLLDECILSGLGSRKIASYFEDLSDIKPHQKIFYSTITRYYEHLTKNNLIEKTQQNFNDIADAAQLLEDTYFKSGTLPYPIILAGTTGTIPAVQKLGKTLLSLESGYVVLPGLQLSDQEYPMTHPLHTQAEFMKAINQQSGVYNAWYGVGDEQPKIMSFFDNKIQSIPVQEQFTFLKAKTLLHEAQLITTVVRHHLEESPDDDIAIVCADPKLSLYIQNSLQKYNFQANSSLSLAIKQSVAFKFLVLYLNFLKTRDLKTLLLFVKHPLFHPKDRMNIVNSIHVFEDKIKVDNVDTYEQCQNLFPNLQQQVPTQLSIPKWLDYVRENLAVVSDNSYAEQSDGETVFQFFDELTALHHKNPEQIPLWTFTDYVTSSFNMCSPMNKKDNLHQRVTMVGSLEARHITAPIVILTALNEGQWPPTIKNDIWLSKIDRENLGMSSLDRRLGLSAHDFACTLSAKKVYFTRSLKIDGTPTEESRWLRRLSVFCKESEGQKKRAEWFYEVSRKLQLGEGKNDKTMAPSYPLCKTNIKKFSFSALELLNKNPYTFYARYILKLRSRNPWFLGLSPADIGNIIHKILEHVTFDADNRDVHLDIIAKAVEPLNIAPPQKMFLQSQIASIVEFVCRATQDVLPSRIIREEKLQAVLGNFIIYGIADRIDFLNDDNKIHLIDYKTGVEPSKAMIEKGYSLQLPLLTYMLSGMFEKDYSDILSQYWVLKGYSKDDRGHGCKITPRPQMAEGVEFTVDIIKKILKYFIEDHNPFVPTDELYQNRGVHPLERC